jgi:hypothetical protein
VTLRLAKSALTSADLLARLAGQDAVVKTVTAIAASTQDAIELAGRAGGTSSYVATLTPGTLTASRTHTLPDLSGTVVVSGAGQAVSLGTITVGTGGVIGAGNDKRFVASRNADDTATLDLMYLNASDDMILAGGSVNVRTSSKVIIGTDPNPGGSELLRVGGDVRAAGIGLGTSLTAGNGILQLANHTTKAGGIALGTDCFIYRIASDTVRRSHSATRYRSDLQINASGMLVNVYDDTGATYMPMEFNGSAFTVKTGNATTAITVDTSQNTTLAGNLSQTGGKYFYLRGDASTDGSVRISSQSSGTATIEKRSGGSWTAMESWA